MLKPNIYGSRTVQRIFALVLGVLVALVLILSLTQLFTGSTTAAPNTYLNFQARLRNSSGSLAPDGYYNIEFKLYDAASGGNLLWTETRTSTNQVRVANGYLTVSLGSVTAFPNTIPWGEQLWLTMNIGGTGTPAWDGEMNPRLQLTAVPHAFHADHANTATSLTDGTNSFTSDSFIHAAPNVVQGINSANTAIQVNQTGAGGLLSLQSNGAELLGLTSSGALMMDEQGQSIQFYRASIAAPTGGGGSLVISRDGPCAGEVQCGITLQATSANAILVSRQQTITMRTNSVDRLVVDNTGAAVTGDLAVSGNLAVDTDTLYVDAANNRVGIGTTSTTRGNLTVAGTVPDAAYAGAIIVTSAMNSSTNDQYGMRLEPVVSPSSASSRTYGGFFAGPYSSSSNVASATIMGMSGFPFYDGTGTLGNAMGVHGRIFNNQATGTINNAFALRADNAVNNGTINNSYGVYVENQTAGTNNYGLYIQGASTYALWVDSGVSRFDGDVTVGTGNNSIYLGKSNDGVVYARIFNADAQTGNPEFKFSEAGVQRAKFYYDTSNGRFVFQNNSNDNQDALYFAEHVTTTGNLTVGGEAILSTISGAGLTDCDDATNSKLLWDATTKTFSCGTDGAGSGGTGITGVGALDSQAKSANGATVSGSNLILQSADADYAGLVNTGTQTFAGNKTFNGTLEVKTNVAIGNNATIDSNRALVVNSEFSTYSGAAINSYSRLNLTATTNQSDNAYSNYSITDIASGSADYTGHIMGGMDMLQHQGSGAVSNGYGQRGILQMSGSGTVANGYGLQGVINATSGTITIGTATQGILQVGSGATVDTGYGVHGNVILSSGANNMDYGIGVNGTVTNLSTSGITVSRGGSFTSANNANFTQDYGVGSFNLVQNTSTGTISIAAGIEARLENTSTGTISVGKGLSVQSAVNSGGGNLTDNYGVHIENQTAGTNNYGLYIQGASTYALWVDSGTSRFDGAVELTSVSGAGLTDCDDAVNSKLLWDSSTGTFSCGTDGSGSGGGGVSTLNSLSGALTIQGSSQIGVSAVGSTITLSIQANSIGNAQLEYDTGQHLTTSSSVTFNYVSTGEASVNGLLQANSLALNRVYNSAGDLALHFGQSGEGASADTGIFYAGTGGTGGLGFAAEGVEAMRIAANGNVNIGGDTTPDSLLSVGSSSQFQVNSSGAIAAVTGITSSGAYVQSGSGANTFSGATTFSASGTALAVTNNATIGGTLAVTGASTLVGGVCIGEAVCSGSTTYTTINDAKITLHGHQTGSIFDDYGAIQGVSTNGGALVLTAGSSYFPAITIYRTGGGGFPGGSVQIGSSDTIGQTLVLDTKTNSGDPSGTNGAMYYNSNAGKFRCYEGGGWKDCITAGGSGITGVGTIDSQTKSANGATVSGSNIILQTADATNPGLVSTGTQTFAGDKTFNGTISVPGSGANSIRLGPSTTSAAGSVSIGVSATNPSHSNSVTIGYLANTSGSSSGTVVIGKSARAYFAGAGGANPTDGVAIGHNAAVGYGGAIAIGGSASSTGAGSVVLGNNASSNNFGSVSVAIGASASVTQSGSIVLGANAVGDVANTFVAGSSSAPINTVFFGKGITNAAPTAYTIQGTGGTGSNISGGGINIAGGRGTGTGLGGDITFQTAPAGSSGSTQNALQTRLTIQSGGNITIGTSDTIGTLLVLDTKTNSGDPSGTNGAMYYNSNAGKFRCYEGGGWKDCISATGITGVGTFVAANSYANGATVSGNNIILGSATQTNPGIVNNTTQTFGGSKTFNDNLLVNGNTTLGNASGDSLTINGTNVSIANNLNFDSNTLFVDAGNNRVGIGTSSPTQKLYVEDSVAGAVGVYVGNTSTATNAQARFSAVSATSQLTFSAYPDTYTAAPYFADRVAMFGESSAAGIIIASNNANGDIRFLTGGSSSTNERFTITNTSINVGQSDTTGILLVLDTKTNSGDPTGTNGAMYYNSNAGKFRCYEGGAWKNCIDTGGTGVSSVGTINSQTKSANGAVISGSSIVLQTADASYPGLVSTGTQTFAGDKTFNGVLDVVGSAPNYLNGSLLNISGSLTSGTNHQSGIFGDLTVSPVSSSSASYTGIGTYLEATNSNVASATIKGIYAGSEYSGTGTLGTQTGIQIERRNSSSGTISSSRGIEIQGVSNSGTIGTNVGMWIGNQTASVAGYGLYIEGASTSALHVASGSSYFGGQVNIGTSDTNATYLVLDTKTSAGDPVSGGTNGAMYYNSSAGKFRCYEGGGWKDCITSTGGGGGGIIEQGGNTLGTDVIIGTNDDNDLHLETNGLNRLTVTSNGDVGIGTSATDGYKLNVQGTGFFSGDLVVNGSSPVTTNDSFSSATLDGAWTLTDPVGGASYSLTNVPGKLQMIMPGGTQRDCYPAAVTCVRMLRSFDNSSIATFETMISGSLVSQFQDYGMMFWQNSSNYVRVSYINIGGSTVIRAIVVSGGTPTTPINQTVSMGTDNGLRITRSGNTWTLEYSTNNGSSWTSLGNYSATLTVDSVGMVTGMAVNNVAFNANFDYFNITYPNASARLGVGVATPSYALDVSTNTTGYAARIQNTSSAGVSGNPGSSSSGLLIDLGISNGSRTTGNYFVAFGGNGTIAGKIQGGANNVSYTTSGADYAEYFLYDGDKPAAGELVSLSPTAQRSVRRSSGASQQPLTGVISSNPGFIGNGPICQESDSNCEANYEETNALVALSGQVETKVNTTNGPIAIGDPITASSVAGEGAKATASGYIVGYAMEPLESGSGTIMVLIRPQYHTHDLGLLQGDTYNLTGNVAIAGNLNVSGHTTLASLKVIGDVETGNLFVGGKLVARGAKPTVVIGSAFGENTEAVVTVNGNDTAGTVTIQTGADSLDVFTSGIVAEVKFSSAFANVPSINMTPVSSDSVGAPFYIEKTADGFRIVFTEAPDEGKAYSFDYFVIGAEEVAQQ